jgi:hypothetical protein
VGSSTYHYVEEIKEEEMGGHVTRMGGRRNEYTIFVGKQDGKRPLGGPRRKWEDNIKMNLRDMRWEAVDRMQLVHDSDQWRAVVNTVMNLWV